MRRPWTQLPPVAGFDRVPDDVVNGRRMLRCRLCGEVVPSLGVGYHRQGRPCVERKADRAAARSAPVDQVGSKCRCGRIKVGLETTESRNWNPDCPVHGVGSAWWASPEQQQARAALSQRLRDLQRRAAEARRQAREGHARA